MHRKESQIFVVIQWTCFPTEQNVHLQVLLFIVLYQYVYTGWSTSLLQDASAFLNPPYELFFDCWSYLPEENVFYCSALSG